MILCLHSSLWAAEETFILIDGKTGDPTIELGSDLDTRVVPHSTFKIVLSLMGYDAGILQDEHVPLWDFQEGYDDYLEVWRQPQTPTSWMTHSCFWYSQVLATQLGIDKVQGYLRSFDYGDQDLSGGLTRAWVSSVRISPREQANFLKKMLCGELPISSNALLSTKSLLFLEELPGSWKLFGKTGWSGSSCKPDGTEMAWLVGWIEKGDQVFPFAYQMRGQEIDRTQRIPRVKKLLASAGILF